MSRCAQCNEYEQQGHNYCRMCGEHVRKGFVPNVRIAVVFNTREKYCGYCGKKRDDCGC